MNAIVIINPAGQDAELGLAFAAEMKTRKWSPVESIPDMYAKTFDLMTGEEAIKKSAKEDVEASVLEAEWEGLDYSVILASGSFAVSKTN
jgi:hypothetical protein